MKKISLVLLAAGFALANMNALAQQAAGPQKPAMAPVVDRAKILVAPGVFGNFSTYKVRPDYYKMSSAERKGAAAEVVAVSRSTRKRSSSTPT
jgi:chlorite dismutase